MHSFQTIYQPFFSESSFEYLYTTKDYRKEIPCNDSFEIFCLLVFDTTYICSLFGSIFSFSIILNGKVFGGERVKLEVPTRISNPSRTAPLIVPTP